MKMVKSKLSFPFTSSTSNLLLLLLLLLSLAVNVIDAQIKTAVTSAVTTSTEEQNKKRHADFQLLLKGAKTCSDSSLLMPDCTACIPGLEKSIDSSVTPSALACNAFIEDSRSIRAEIRTLTKERFPDNGDDRLFGLYPYLETPPFMFRQEIFGHEVAKRSLKNIVDIGAYYNPIYMFFDDDNFCPETVVIIEPILNPFSGIVPCKRKNKETHIIVLPITFKQYKKIKSIFPDPDGVVCIGCDSYYGPNRKQLQTTFAKPFTLFLEFPYDYVHNGPYKQMGNNKSEKERLVYDHQYIVDTTETKFTKRHMKIIEYID